MSSIYCGPCRNIVEGSLVFIPGRQSTFAHHPDNASVNAAVDLPCAICARAFSGDITGIKSTTASFLTPSDPLSKSGEDDMLQLRILDSDSRVILGFIAFVPLRCKRFVLL